MTTAPDPSPYAQLFRRAILLLLNMSRFGVIRKVPTAQWNTSSSSLFCNTDAQYLNVQKRILDCPEYSAIARADRRTQQQLRNLAIPSSLLPGLYVVPVLSIDDIQNLLHTYRAERTHLVNAFLEVYPYIRTQATLSLNTLYNPNNYPPLDVVQQAFRIQATYLTFDLPTHLETSNPTLYHQEVQHARTRVHTILRESQRYLRHAFLTLLQALTQRLLEHTEILTKPPQLTHIVKLRHFAHHFPKRMVTQDDTLLTLTQHTTGLLHGITPSALKENPKLATTLRDNLLAIQTTVEAGLTEAPTHPIAPVTTTLPRS